ncbi:MAG: hypothetical protein F9K18_13920 [Thermoanaerobaculia bacterium]|nr:MAG: hypothetical protein F9K18_13920 [Thermoanaerobaculia bacterium]
MAVLITGFAIVIRIEAIEARYPGGWDAFWREAPNETGCCDDDLVAFSFPSRPEFRAWLERLERRGFVEVRTILDATELSRKIRTPEEIAQLQTRIATTRELALVYRRLPIVPDWLALFEGRLPGAQVAAGGACLAERGPVGLAVPEGWTVEEAVPLRDEPESGDELLPTWHEFLREMSLEQREECLRWGPDAYQAFAVGSGGPRLFGGPIRPSANVIEQEVVVRDPDGTERVMVGRWTRLPE